MSTRPKRIGVLTGGGDCPGLNAVIRAVVKSAIFDHGWEVIGIEDGFLGLIEDRVRPLDPCDVSGILTLGGTILGASNKADPLRFPVGYNADGEPVFEDRTRDCLDTLARHDLDTIVVIGGDGTMSCANNFIPLGVNFVGVPKTIDNDLVGTDITFGFSTAVQTATEAIDRLHTTAMSHHRVMVVEVMGRNAGWIALYSGVASGCDVIIIPEIEYDLGLINDFVKERAKYGRRFSLVCISEGARPKGGKQVVNKIDPTSPDPIRLGGIGDQLAVDIERCTDIETRAVTLGHVIRGGSPVASDRVMATEFGHNAIELIAQGRMNRLVVVQGGAVTDAPLMASADKQRLVPLDDPTIAAARAVGTCFGDVPAHMPTPAQADCNNTPSACHGA